MHPAGEDSGDSGEIECQTIQVTLQAMANRRRDSTAQIPPSFTALSYVCGAKPADRLIERNGRDWSIRKKLWRFLKQYATPQAAAPSSEWFWIDAICIYQDDTRERTHQVKLMAAIYQAAAGVLAWLGPAYENSDIVMAKLPNTPLDIRALNKVSWSLAMGGLCV